MFDRAVGQVYVDNIRVQAKGPGNVWTSAGDNGGTNPPGGAAPSFSADQTALLAAPLTPDELLSSDDLLASLTPDESALVNADAPG